MIFRFPGKIPAQKVVKEPVSQLDVVASLFDYLSAPKLNNDGDGRSLRRFIEDKDYNRNSDNGVVVAELEKLSKSLRGSKDSDSVPNFLVRHKKWKLIIPKQAKSSIYDMVRQRNRFYCDSFVLVAL